MLGDRLITLRISKGHAVYEIVEAEGKKTWEVGRPISSLGKTSTWWNGYSMVFFSCFFCILCVQVIITRRIPHLRMLVMASAFFFQARV